jgi:hypothetical protein
MNHTEFNNSPIARATIKTNGVRKNLAIIVVVAVVVVANLYLFIKVLDKGLM